jgi:acetyl esterase/lipase
MPRRTTHRVGGHGDRLGPAGNRAAWRSGIGRQTCGVAENDRRGVDATHDYEIAYGPTADNVIEVWESRSPAPSVHLVVIHGGFWRAAYTRRHIRRFCTALAREGNKVYSIEYSRSDSVRAGWPRTFQDVASAVDFCAADATAANPRNRVVLLGHSAGGHLALWAASRHRVQGGVPGLARHEPPLCAGVIALAGVCDLGMASRMALGNRAVDHLIGGDQQSNPERFAVADPVRLVPTGIPSILVHSGTDTTVPLAVSRSYAARASAAGDLSELWELRRTGHLELISPHSGGWPRILSAITMLTEGVREPGGQLRTFHTWPASRSCLPGAPRK